MPKTRKELFCEVFGLPTDLLGNVLPTNSDVMKCYLWNRNLLKESANGKDPSVNNISRLILTELKQIWQKASIPIISDQRILSLIANLNQKYKSIKKNMRKSQEKTLAFREVSEKTLFDISACKCGEDFDNCFCKNKVPKRERDFLTDQRTVRKMIIGNTDKKISQSLQKSLARKAKEEARLSKIEGPCAKKQKCDNLAFDEVEEIKQINFPPDSSEEYKPSTPSQLRRPSPSNFRKSVKLPNLAQACDRSASLLVNAVLQDLQIITKTNSSQIVDRTVRGLYFNGRKDKTIQQDKKGTKYYRSTVTEEHVVLLSEPGSLFLGHVSPMSGSAKNITLSIKTFLKDADSNINELKAIGCDGTVINTGLTNGVIRQLELFIGRPLQWHICLLHTNELPLRHLIQFLDGKTSNPRCFSGEIGKMLENCEKLSIAAFEPIETELPSIHQNDLSTDQTYLFDISLEQMIMDIPNNIEFLKLPCHTQAVERMIKLVTEASLSVCGEKARDGFIRTKLASQNDIPKFETKKHFII
ncbi:hypothetical protein HELRODRAFT_165085 [Helobdella robusta]|uniref:Uncharacterized protein n=1 Tax=Helobdella robusta TaxID=6412 RepID=T1EW98_HELRO|nr:hypothetical protein HELRODRAFT_165085 [Helobdella robusta]ESN92944.1 hypothetical protein HELRODRAFT_165085 [Helobdella robusta]